MKKIYLVGLVAITLPLCAKKSFTVTTTQDSGHGSFRHVLSCANASKTPSLITFDLSTNDCGYDRETDTWIFEPRSELPTIESTVYIDGYSQYGSKPNDQDLDKENNAVIKIELRGTHLQRKENGLGSRGLVFGHCATDSSVKGLSITKFPKGIVVYGCHVSIAGTYVGLAPNGVTVQATHTGIAIESSAEHTKVGTGTTSGNNLIVAVGGDSSAGIIDTGTSTVVKGTVIGLDRSGNSAVGAADYGLLIEQACMPSIGGKAFGDRVVSAGHRIANFYLDGTIGARLKNVFGGTNTTGNLALGGGAGLVLSEDKMCRSYETKKHRGVKVTGSLFSGNDGCGIVVGKEADAAPVVGASIRSTFIGTDVTGENALSNNEHGMIIGSACDTKVTDSLLNYNKQNGLCVLGSIRANVVGCDISFNEIDGVFLRAAHCDSSAITESANMTLSIVFNEYSNGACSCDNGFGQCLCYQLDCSGNKVCC